MLKDEIRVCHLTTIHPRKDVRVFYKECTSLARQGYDVHLVVADGLGDEVCQKVKIHDTGKLPNRWSRILISPWRVFKMALSVHAKLYHFHDPELLPVGILLKRFTRAKIIYDAHEFYVEYFLQKDYLPPLLRIFFSRLIGGLETITGRQIDQVIVTTQQHAAGLKHLNKHLDILYNYPMLSEWDTQVTTQIADKGRNLCYIGNIIAERGITQLIQAVEKVECVLHLAGGYEPLSYRDELMKLPGWEKVVEYGYVNRDKATQIISSSLVGVVLFLPRPIHYTSLSTKVFEYMAGGIASLVPEFPIWKSIVCDAGCGLCVNTEDVEQISNALNLLLGDPDRAAEMGRIGRQLVLERYNWETQVPMLISIYRRLLGS